MGKRIAEYQKKWRSENKERWSEICKAANRRYRQKHRKQVLAAQRERQKEYRQTAHGKLVRARCQRARNCNISTVLLAKILERDQCCQHCSSTENLHIDHKHPISKGGKSTEDNLWILCGDCNQFKYNRLWLPTGGMVLGFV